MYSRVRCSNFVFAQFLNVETRQKPLIPVCNTFLDIMLYDSIFSENIGQLVSSCNAIENYYNLLCH
ncbi:hypothetical protein HZS_1226 [Henneguya salminicola]|nr:hypothetical protein HZS_1226 [Henneguya salminicola]